jgi:hypothetical protein
MSQDAIGCGRVDADGRNLGRSQALLVDLEEFVSLVDGMCSPSTELADGGDDPVTLLQRRGG